MDFREERSSYLERVGVKLEEALAGVTPTLMGWCLMSTSMCNLVKKGGMSEAPNSRIQMEAEPACEQESDGKKAVVAGLEQPHAQW